jgi:nitronate monooxygenase
LDSRLHGFHNEVMNISLQSRFTRRFGLTTPIALAPMAVAADGGLTAACARAGALGLLGGGYAELDWTRREYSLAEEAAGDTGRLGCGFIIWRLDQDASALDWVLERRPRAVMLSFGDPRPYAQRIAASGAELIYQLQRLGQVPVALEAGASVIIAQGGEAGGHSMSALDGRSTFSFVPEVADWLAAHSPDTLLLAAGGIAEGRTLAAARVLGADGALVGSRLWATRESKAAQSAKEVAVAASGDDTGKSGVFDILQRRIWPAPYGQARTLRNAMLSQWENREQELLSSEPAFAAFEAGVKEGDYTRAPVTVGEGVGLIRDLPPAAEVIARMTDDATRILGSP